MMLSRHFLGWYFSVLAILSLLPEAIGGGMAGSFERIGPLYQTYRIAVEIWGADQKKFIPGLASLTGSHPNGGANFLEMLNHLDGNMYTAGDMAEFEVDDINKATPIYNAADMLFYKDAPSQVPLSKLFRNTPADWPDALAKIRTVLKTAHEVASREGTLESIREHRLRLEVCHEEIIRFRQSDLAKGAVKDLVKVDGWGDAKPQASDVDWHHDNSFKIYTFDAQGTIDASTNVNFEAGEVERWAANYGTNDAYTLQAKNHYKVVAEHIESKTLESRFLGGFC
ncbi:hypothetical protein EDB81DRAFT_789375 [Dactylonectria macrodidyma]|uniref:Uncharacterized protein n=1 Tax=Dactylonectria macrodidyma TaxID=307937 RepID=A0A9P9F4P5_9HYPO|nr:hypothetical protein EDB81DRAFT_789375 [Dactylonectria macrodidyma]